MKEDGEDGGRDGEMTPARAVVQGRRQNREGGDAVEEDRDSEPEEGHKGVRPSIAVMGERILVTLVTRVGGRVFCECYLSVA